MFTRSVGAAVLLLAALTTTAAAESGIVELGTLDGGDTSVVAMNNSGTVIGYAVDANYRSHAVRWDRTGKIFDLDVPSGYSTHTVAINAVGQIAGVVDVTGRVVRWEPTGKVVDLPTLPGYVEHRAVGIDDTGRVSGNARNIPEHKSLAVRWDRDGKIIELATLGRWAYAVAANARGDIVGYGEALDGNNHAIRWDRWGHAKELGDFEPTAINDEGTVVGSRWTGTGMVPVRWDSRAGLTDLAIPSNAMYSVANAVNNRNMAMGVLYLSGGVDQLPLWDRQGRLTVLEAPADAGFLCDINDSGTVVGYVRPGNRAAKWGPDGRMTLLPDPPNGTATVAQLINNAGTIVGSSSAGRKIMWLRRG